MNRSDATALPMPFVSGCGRSGTTLLRFMLDSHAMLAIPPECHFWDAVLAVDTRQTGWVDDVFRIVTTSLLWKDFGLDAAELRRSLDSASTLGEAIRAVYAAYAARFGKIAWGDKTARTHFRMQATAQVMPTARFVHIIRDGRDVAVSLRRCWWVADLTSDAQRIAFWASHIKAAREGAASGVPYCEIRYERLVSHPEETLRAVCDFIGYDFDPNMLAYQERSQARLDEFHDITSGEAVIQSREDRLVQHERTLQAPNDGRVGRWKHEMDREDVRQCEETAGSLLRELGYVV